MKQIGLASRAARLPESGRASGAVPLTSLCIAILLALGSTASLAAPQPAAPEPAAVDGARIAAADKEPGNWMSTGRTYDEQRFSPLKQVNDGNVDKLGLAWSYKLDIDRGVEATPIVVDGVMYTTGPFSIVYALDARNGKLLWKYDPQSDRSRAGEACCDAVNRGVAVWNGKVYVGVLDGRLEAIDAKTGQKVWSVDTRSDHSRSITITGAPRIVKGKVIIGNGGAEFGLAGEVVVDAGVLDPHRLADASKIDAAVPVHLRRGFRRGQDRFPRVIAQGVLLDSSNRHHQVYARTLYLPTGR